MNDGIRLDVIGLEEDRTDAGEGAARLAYVTARKASGDTRDERTIAGEWKPGTTAPAAPVDPRVEAAVARYVDRHPIAPAAPDLGEVMAFARQKMIANLHGGVR